MGTALLFIIILSILVIVHEAGHFFAAKFFGMRVYEFGIGFPPRAIGWYKDPNTKKWVRVKRKSKSTITNTSASAAREEEYPGTVYSLNWLPLGGFVKVKGENGEEAAEPDSFAYHSAWKRLVVLVAGVFMNVVLAALVLGVGFMAGLPADFSEGVDSRAIVVQAPQVTIQQVIADSPAQEAGFKFGDKIIAVGGTEVATSGDMIAQVQSRAGEPTEFTVMRGEERLSIMATPEIDQEDNIARIGAVLADAGVIRYPWYEAVWRGIVGAIFGFINIVIGFYLLIKNLLLGQGLIFEVAGPVGIAVIIGESARLGFSYLLNITAMISLSLAVINIMPIPALDGGRAFFVILEKIFGRRFSMKYEQLAHTIGFVLLLFLILVITTRDVLNLF